MAPRGLKTAVLLASCSALVLSPEEGAASRRLAELRKAEEDRVGEYFRLAADARCLDRRQRAVSRARASWERRGAGFVRWLNESR